MTADERREKARLRSERWRRAHGIMPRRPAQRPWLAEGISRSTWYRRRKQTRSQAALAATLTRAKTFVHQLQADLAEAARCHAVAAAVIGEMGHLLPKRYPGKQPGSVIKKPGQISGRRGS